tara:strand:+ start:253 stop:471 length:219 start_codon:yes stop_codon:yes gene_type:complete
MRNQYPRLRNGKLEGGGLPSNHIFLEEKKEVWVLCESSLGAMGISAVMKKSFPEYKLCLCNRETFLRLGGNI